MFEVTSGNAARYLRSTGRVSSNDTVNIDELAGGVSNLVLLITLPNRGERFVLKQARGRLQVKEEWLCPVERIWREVETLRICGELLEGWRPVGVPIEPGAPELLWEDRENYIYAMTAAPEGHRTWKELLLAGETAISEGIATTCGQLLARLHAESWNDADIAARLDDRSYFDQLRLDPYYRHVARRHLDVAPQMQRLIDSVWQNRRCLVHGDYSPKNLLVWDDRSRLAPQNETITRSVMATMGRGAMATMGNVMLIDFEVGHYGDPTFDLGFFLTHLVLKSVWAGPRRAEYLQLAALFWESYSRLMRQSLAAGDLQELEQRMVMNLAGCMLARVDGKSPVEYLSPQQQATTWRIAREWIVQPPSGWQEAVARLERV